MRKLKYEFEQGLFKETLVNIIPMYIYYMKRFRNSLVFYKDDRSITVSPGGHIREINKEETTKREYQQWTPFIEMGCCV